MPSPEFWLVNDVTVSEDVAGAEQGWLDIFIFCQLAVVEGEIIITTTGNLDTRQALCSSHPMIFSSGQAGQLQLICKPCPQTLHQSAQSGN